MPTRPAQAVDMGNGSTQPVGDPGPLSRLWHRELPNYPDPLRRYASLAIVVATTVVLYYMQYVQFSVATSILNHFGMSYSFFVYASVIGNVVGAFTSLVAGFADRWGRANLVVYGLLLAAVLLFALPASPNKWVYLILFSAVGLVEGIVLVATPALIRDFSPQLGRATAMGYWTMGPVLGSLVVTVVTSSTLGSSTWQDELRYSGIGGLIVFVVALFALRELSPGLRGQIMVSLEDKTLVEARAKQGAPQETTRSRWLQMMRLNVVGSAFAISVYLLLYYAAVGNFVVYFSVNYGFSQQRANGLLNWYWGFNAVALLLVGLLSDRLRVRKPFMLLGAIGSGVATVIFALLATHPHTDYYTFAWLFAAIGVFSGVAYAPWMASFTETVEKHNPAATATGLAVWGWVLRVVIAASSAILPQVVTSVTPLVGHGEAVASAQEKAGPALAVVNSHAQLFAQLGKFKPDQVPPALAEQAAREVGPADLALVQKAQPQLAILQKYGPEVAKASEEGPKQWQTWWWVTLGGQIVFIPFIFVMAGRWSPRKAREDVQRHRELVDSEVRALSGQTG